MGVKRETTSRLLEIAALITDARRGLVGLEEPEFENPNSLEHWDRRLAVRELESAGDRVKTMIECTEAKKERGEKK